jgi:hypothetical protein
MRVFEMLLKIGKWSKQVGSFAEASAAHEQRRGAGAKMKVLRHEGQIFGETGLLARVSHNGRVWRAGEWQPGDTPLYDPRTRPASA